jgi:hypothetical protein
LPHHLMLLLLSLSLLSPKLLLSLLSIGSPP